MKTKSDGSTASYYDLPEGAKTLQDLISHRDMNHSVGELFCAAYRYGLAEHSEKLRDAKKIAYYANAEIARLERLAALATSGLPLLAITIAGYLTPDLIAAFGR